MSLKPPHLLASHERLGVLNGWFSVFVGILALFGQVLGAFLGGKKVEVAGVRQQPKGWFQTRFFLTLTWGRFPICLFLALQYLITSRCFRSFIQSVLGSPKKWMDQRFGSVDYPIYK